MEAKQLPQKIIEVILCLAPHLAPISSSIDKKQAEQFLINNITKLILEIPLFFRIGLLWSLRLFNILPLFAGYGFKTFNNLSWDNQSGYIKSWAESRRSFKRDIFKAIKGIIALVTLSNKSLWQEMNYDPQKHLEERIKLRQTILNEKRTTHNS